MIARVHSSILQGIDAIQVLFRTCRKDTESSRSSYCSKIDGPTIPQPGRSASNLVIYP